MSYLITRVLAKPRLILDEMCVRKFRVLCQTGLIFPRINGPNVSLLGVCLGLKNFLGPRGPRDTKRIGLA